MACHSYRLKRGLVIVMKIEIPILAALLVLATELMTRAALQGVEQALVWTLVDWSARRVRVVRRKLWRRR
jgi:hypothetical protein